MRNTIVFVFISMLGVSLTSAQNTPQKPAPEHKRLNYFVGSWTLSGNKKPSAAGPGGKFTLTEHNEWMDGEFFLVNRASAKTPTGNGTSLGIMGYDPEKKTYTYRVFTSDGEYEFSRGTLADDTWIWNRVEVAGNAVRKRYTVKQVSPTSYTFKFEMAPAGADWSTINEGTATKTK